MALRSLFINELLSTNHGLHHEFYTRNDKIVNLFFFIKSENFKQFGETSKPEAINMWLSRFYVSHKTLAPVLRVVEGNSDDFELYVLVENKEKPLEAPFELAQPSQGKQCAEVKFEVLRELSLLAEVFPQLNTNVLSKGEKSYRFDSAEFAPVFFEILPLMRLFGNNAILPKSLRHLIRHESSLKVKKNSVESSGFLHLDDLLDFEWKIAVGDEILTETEFRKSLKGLSGFIKFGFAQNRFG